MITIPCIHWFRGSACLWSWWCCLHVLSSRVNQVHFIHREGSVGFRQGSSGKNRTSQGVKKIYIYTSHRTVIIPDWPVMYDCSVWTHAGNSWKTETNKIFLLAGKHKESSERGEREKREQRKREFKENSLCVRCVCVSSRGSYNTIK